MIIPARVSCKIIGIPKGSRHPRDIHVGERVDVNISEFTDFEAPVATSWESHRGINGRQETRWANGNHYQPLIIAKQRQSNHMTAADLSSAISNGASFDGLPEYMKFYGEVSEFSDIEFRAKHIPDLTAYNEMLDYFATFDDIVLIDGLAWKKASEPVYVLTDQGIENMTLKKAESLAVAPNSIYRADKREIALMEADLRSLPRAIIQIDVFIPESIIYKDEHWSLIKTAEYVAMELGSIRASEITDNEWSAFKNLPGLASTLAEAWDDDVADDLVNYLNMVSDLTHEDYGNVRDTIVRWQNRPIEFNLDDDAISSPRF